MRLPLLLVDELRGYYRTKAVVLMWIGLPLISILLKWLQPEIEGMDVSVFTALMLTSLGGTLGAVTLGTSIAGDMNQHVYDLFLIRPVKRYEIVISKFLAVYLLLLGVLAVSMVSAIAIDTLVYGTPVNLIVASIQEPLLLTVASMAFACATGTAVGIVMDSVAVAAIASLYLGGQLSSVPFLVAILLFKSGDLLFPLLLAAVAALLTLSLAVVIFGRRQL